MLLSSPKKCLYSCLTLSKVEQALSCGKWKVYGDHMCAWMVYVISQYVDVEYTPDRTVIGGQLTALRSKGLA